MESYHIGDSFDKNTSNTCFSTEFPFCV